MLKTHIDTNEENLLFISRIPANAGHSLHMGTPRETFIREFLEDHLNSNVAIGTGEIFDCNSRPGETRNQFDIVVYKRDYPRIDFGGKINGFLAESVIATIEVKSTLDRDGMKQAIKAAHNAKSFTRNIQTSFTTGYVPPSVLNYVVAYDGPARMETAHGWIQPIHSEEGINLPNIGATAEERERTPSPSLDGIFVLGKGFLQYDNSPMGFNNDHVRKQHPDIRWTIANTNRGSLLMFFMLLLQATSNVQGAWLNPIPYLSQFHLDDIRYAP